MNLDRRLDALLKHDPVYNTLQRLDGYTLRKAYMKPGLLFGMASGRLPDPTTTLYGEITFFAQRLVVRDWMDIELLWKPWILAVRPEALGKPACVKLDDNQGYALRVFVFDGDSACRHWDRLRDELEETRRR